MYKEILENIKDVSIWPQISIGIFFIFFVSLIVWTIRVDRDYIRAMKNMPIEDQPADESSAVSETKSEQP